MLLALALTTFTASAPPPTPDGRALDYRRFKLHELVAKADTIVQGRIRALDDVFFTLRVEASLVGGATVGDELRLPRFVDWGCGSRDWPYAVGQELFVFAEDGRLVGAGDEGELHVRDGGALLHHRVHGARYEERWIDGRRQTCAWVPTAEVRDGIEAVRAAFAFHWERGEREKRLRIHPWASAAELERLSAHSGFLRALIAEIRSAPGYEGAPLERAPAHGLSLHASGLDPSFTRAWDDGVEPETRTARCLAWNARVGEDAPPELLFPIDSGYERDEPFLGRAVADERGRLTAAEGLPFDEPPGLREGFAGEARVASVLQGLVPEAGAPTLLVSNLPPPDFLSFLSSPSNLGLQATPDHDHRGRIGFFELSGPARGRLVSGIAPRLLGADAGEAGCAFGDRFATPGDLNGDGFVDLVATGCADRIGREPNALGPSGLAVLFLGPERGLEHWRWIAPAQLVEPATEVTPAFGNALTALGRAPGVSRSWIAIGEPDSAVGGPHRGAVHLVALDADGDVEARLALDARSTALPLEDGDEFGAVLAECGDLDGDGVPELLVGGARALFVVFLEPDGLVRSVRRHELARLHPEAVELRALAVARPAGGKVWLAASLFVGPARPFDVELLTFELAPDGELRAL